MSVNRLKNGKGRNDCRGWRMRSWVKSRTSRAVRRAWRQGREWVLKGYNT